MCVYPHEVAEFRLGKIIKNKINIFEIDLAVKFDFDGVFLFPFYVLHMKKLFVCRIIATILLNFFLVEK